MKKGVFIMLSCLLCFAFTSDVQKRSIRENGFDIECYVSLKKVNDLDINKTYYWYKSGGVHQSVFSVGGQVLHNDFIKYYRSNQIAEQGVFNYGLKNGVWKSWYKNGALRAHEEWKNGLKHGAFIAFDDKGNRTSFSEYKNNLKSGLWTNYKTDQITSYKKDEVQPKKEARESFIKRLFKKKDRANKMAGTKNKANVRHETIKEEGFFKRLFKKKEKPNKVEASKPKIAPIKPKEDITDKPKEDNKEGFLKRLFKKKKSVNKEEQNDKN